jgi:hypothetical protein
MGFEPTYDGFANRCLTTWLPRPNRDRCCQGSPKLLHPWSSEQAVAPGCRLANYVRGRSTSTPFMYFTSAFGSVTEPSAF